LNFRMGCALEVDGVHVQHRPNQSNEVRNDFSPQAYQLLHSFDVTTSGQLTEPTITFVTGVEGFLYVYSHFL
jgi:hypothetical protein